jgi:dTDP-4-amino-4,6-dideoxygalactose transaminase
MGISEQNYVKEAFASNWVAPLGPNVNGFENDISNYIADSDQFHTAALTSGTAALHLALRILNVRKDDVVMVQSFTFCGTTNPVSYLGAEIVFIDSEWDTWNMCPLALKDALEHYKNRSVKAIMPVHLYGMPSKMDEIQQLADEYNVPIVEDAAEALGSRFKNQSCGTFGEMAALSFNGNKIITTSGGGALVSKQKHYIDQARFLATQARDDAPHYQHSQIGYNYRMSNIVAGIGRGQMEVLDERVAQRRANNQRYREFFTGIDGITFQTEPDAEKMYVWP